MSLNSSRASRPARGSAGPRRAGLAALLTSALLLVSTACGFDAQTNKPYTPAEGVNFDVVASSGKPDDTVHVRNLLIISSAPGEGVLSASMVTNNRDSLAAVSGKAIKLDGSDGAPFTATTANQISLANGVLVVLTDGPLITLKSADLAAGLDAEVTLQFANAGTHTARVPVMDGNEPQYQSIKPTPAASATP